MTGGFLEGLSCCVSVAMDRQTPMRGMRQVVCRTTQVARGKATGDAARQFPRASSVLPVGRRVRGGRGGQRQPPVLVDGLSLCRLDRRRELYPPEEATGGE